MIVTVAIVLAVLWLIGILTAYTLGGLLHLLIVIAIILVVFNLLRGRKAN